MTVRITCYRSFDPQGPEGLAFEFEDIKIHDKDWYAHDQYSVNDSVLVVMSFENVSSIANADGSFPKPGKATTIYPMHQFVAISIIEINT